MRLSSLISVSACTVLLLGIIVTARSQGNAAAPGPQKGQPVFEYASVRFMEERTSIVWPDGSVENVLQLNGRTKFVNTGEKYPKGSDYRMYWLTIAMNIMGQRGFELAHMQDNDVVMRRAVSVLAR